MKELFTVKKVDNDVQLKVHYLVFFQVNIAFLEMKIDALYLIHNQMQF